MIKYPLSHYIGVIMINKLSILLLISSTLLAGCFDNNDKNIVNKKEEQSNQEKLSYVTKTGNSISPYYETNRLINKDKIVTENADKVFNQTCNSTLNCNEFKFDIDSIFVDFDKIQSISIIPVYEENREIKNQFVGQNITYHISQFLKFMTFNESDQSFKDINKNQQFYVLTRTVFKGNPTPVYGLDFFQYRDYKGFNVVFSGTKNTLSEDNNPKITNNTLATLFADKDYITKINNKTLLRFIKNTAEDAIKTKEKIEEENRSQKENENFWKQSIVEDKLNNH